MSEASCAGMVETVEVSRKCWLGSCANGHPVALVTFEISWTMAAGFRREDKQTFDMHILDLPRGSTPMVSPVYTLPYDGHPSACTQGMVYLIRTYDAENDLEDVVARFMRKPNPHDDDDEVFQMPGDLAESGPFIYPLPIKEL